MATSLTGVGAVWASLSLLAAILCCSGFYLPFWIQVRLQKQSPENGYPDAPSRSRRTIPCTVMTVADPDAHNFAEDIPEAHTDDEYNPGEAEYSYWEDDEPPRNNLLIDQSGEEYSEGELQTKQSAVVVKLYDVRVMVEELDEYEVFEEDEEEEQNTPRAVLLAAWWEYKRQNRHKRMRKKVIILYRVDNSDRNAEEEEFNQESC